MLLTSAYFYNKPIKAAFVSLCNQEFDKMKTVIITTALIEQEIKQSY